MTGPKRRWEVEALALFLIVEGRQPDPRFPHDDAGVPVTEVARGPARPFTSTRLRRLTHAEARAIVNAEWRKLYG